LLIQRSLLALPLVFPALAVAVFPGISGSVQKRNDRDD